jgi:ADP-heptose:LPS heptosyltransferase
MKIFLAPNSEYDIEKEYPYYQELINKLSAHKVTLFGSVKENKRFVNCFDLRGCLLQSAIHELSKSDLFIGNDGGLYHIAANLGIKTIVIFMKPDNFFRVAHLNKPNVKVLYRPTVNEILDNL